jgi:DNA-binding NarL/FixJ family response regulator
VTRVVIVDPQPAVRAGLAALLRGEPGLVPVGAAGSAEEALETVRRTSPDLVLLEPLLGTGDGLQLIRRITGAEAAPRFVAYT